MTVHERLDFITNLSTNCEIIQTYYNNENDLIVDTSISYEDYIHLLSNTVFVPCPSGRNPETFRIYEALEVGAIPLIVKPEDNKNYLNFGLWNEYPGQIFNNWKEIKDYLISMNKSKYITIEDYRMV
eukprot:gene20559-26664_t